MEFLHLWEHAEAGGFPRRLSLATGWVDSRAGWAGDDTNEVKGRGGGEAALSRGADDLLGFLTS